MLAFSLAAWCALLAFLALAAELGGLTEIAGELAHWAQAALLAALVAGGLTLVANLPPLRRLWPVLVRRVSLGTSGSGEL